MIYGSIIIIIINIENNIENQYRKQDQSQPI